MSGSERSCWRGAVSRVAPCDRNNGSGSARRPKIPADNARPPAVLNATVWPVVHRGISLPRAGASHQLELLLDWIDRPLESGTASLKSRSGGGGAGTGTEAMSICALAIPGAARHVTTSSVSDLCTAPLDAPHGFLAVRRLKEIGNTPAPLRLSRSTSSYPSCLTARYPIGRALPIPARRWESSAATVPPPGQAGEPEADEDGRRWLGHLLCSRERA